MFHSHITSLFHTSRPRFWLYLAGPVLIGGGFPITPGALGLFLFFLIPANLILYGINDLYDEDTDSYNLKKETYETRVTSTSQKNILKLALLVSCALYLILLVVSPASIRILLLIWLALSIGYSAPPIRFKARPFFDSISNILYILPGVIAYTALTGTAPPIEAFISGSCWAIAMHLFSAIPDQVPDTKAGLSTTATTLGTNGSLIACVVLWLLSSLYATHISTWGLVMLIYPLIPGALYLRSSTSTQINEMYWKFPIINTLIGGILFFIRIQFI